MDHPLTTLTLILLTLLSLAAWVAAIVRLRRVQTDPASDAAAHQPAGVADRLQAWLVALVAAGSAGLFIYRWLAVHGRWQPLAAHVDGLLLVASLLAAAILFIQSRPRLRGLSAFALPLLLLILAWAVCASAWTYKPFHLPTLHPLWMAVHLGGVYLGTLASAIAAVAGGMYLYIQRRLKRKRSLAGLGRLASLEALETLMIRAATLGFTLLSVGLAAGAVILTDPKTFSGAVDPWFIAKIVLAAIAWSVYALLMNVRYATHFRGPRAAWLSIAGLLLLLATYAVVTALPARPAPQGSGRGPAVAAANPPEVI